MFRTWWQKFFSFPRSRFARRRGYRPPTQLTRRTFRLSMTALEDRLAPATFTDNGTTLNLVLNTANTNAAIVSNGTNYVITLTGDTWSGTNDANVTGNGTATLTVTTAGIAAFTNQISLVDAAAGGDSVAFNNSGANVYANNFNINLSNAAAGSVAFNGATSFSGASSLSASTTDDIAVNSGATVGTTSGNLTLTATGTVAGNYVGITVNNATVQTGTGSVLLQGTGGNTGIDNNGVEVLAGSKVQTTGAGGSVTVTGTGGGSSGNSNLGVLLSGSGAMITSGGGKVSVTGQGGGTGASGSNYGLAVGSGDTITAGGTGTVTVMGTGGNTSGGSDAGVVLAGVGTAATITSSGGAVSVTGFGGGSGAGNTNAGVAVQSMASITAGGNGTVTVNGTGGNTTGQQNFGVWVTVSGASITSSGGAVTVTGTAGSGPGAVGILVDTGTVISSGNNAAVTLTSDSMSLVSSTSVNAGTGIVTLDPKTPGTTVNLGGANSAGTLGLTNAELATITAGILRIGDAGGIAQNFTITSAITAPAGWNTLSLFSNTGSISQSAGASITVANLLLIFSNRVTLADPGNTVGTLSMVGVQGASFVNSTSLTMGSVDPGLEALVNGGAFTGGATSVHDINITALGDGSLLTVSQPINSNFLSFGPGNITLAADDMAVNAAVNASTAIVTLRQVSPARGIDLGVGLGPILNTLGLTDAELGQVTAGVLRIGRTDTGATVGVSAPITAHAGYNTLTLLSGGGILDFAPTDTLTVTNLAVRAGAGISLDTVVSHLAVQNTNINNIRVANTGATTLTTVDTLDGSAGNTEGNFAAAGTTTFSASSPFTYAVNFTSGGTINTTANETSPPAIHTDNITVNAGVTVQSTGGDVNFLAGDDIIINATASVLALAGNIDFRTGFGDNDNEGIMTINGTVSANAATGTVALNVNSTNSALPAGTDIVSEASTGSIVAAGLLLLNLPGSVSGASFALDTSMTNLVDTIAATTHAEIDFQNNGPLVVGSVSSSNEGITSFGIFTNNNDVTLCTLAGEISLTQALNAGTANVRLGAAGAVTQNTTGKITGADLGVTAAGNIDFDVASPVNHVTGTVALNSTSGSVDFQDDSAFTIGTVAASDCFTGASGISGGPNQDITLCSGGTMNITSPITAPGATVRLQSGGGLSQTAAGTITAANLGVRAGGAINLCVIGSPNAITGTFAADTTGGPAGSGVMFLDADGFTVGTVTASDCFTTDAVGVTTNNGVADLVNLSGNLTLLQGIGTGTGVARLNSAGAVTQTIGGAGAVAAGSLAVRAAGTVDLAEVPNTVGTFAAQDTAANATIQFTEIANTLLTIGAIAPDACALGATGVISNNGDITITADNLNILNAINAGKGAVRLQQASVGQAINVGGADAAGTLGLTNAELGNVTARVLVIGRNDPGFFGQIAVSAPITLAPANVPTLVLRAGGSIGESPTGTLSVNNLAVLSGSFTTLEGDNQVGTLAGRNLGVNSQFSFTEAPNTALTIGTVDVADPIGFPTGLAGIVTQNGNIIITSDNLTITQPVGAGSGCVFLQQRTPANTVNVGGADAAGVLGLSNSDLSFITAAGLRIGRADGGAVTITAPITLSTAAAPPAVGVNSLLLESLQTVTETGAGSISINTLAVAANGGATLNGSNDLRLVGALIAGGGYSVTNAPSAGNPTGLLTVGNFTVCGSMFNGISAAGNVTITADDLNITAPIIAPGFCVTLQPFTAGQNITIGTEPGGTLGLTNAELNQVTAAVLQIGRNDAGYNGTIQVTAPITLSTAAAPPATGVNDLNLVTGGAISETAGSMITVANLAAESGSTVSLTNANSVTTLAGVSNGTFQFVNGGTLIVGAVNLCMSILDGVTTNNADATLISNTGALQLQQFMSAGTGTVRLQAATGIASTAATGTITAARLGARNTTGGDIQLDQANAVGVLAAINNAATGGGINFRTTGALSLDAVSADGTLFAAVSGVTTTVTGGTVRLQEAGLSQTTAGIVTSGLLGVRNSAGDVILDQANAVNIFAANNTAANGRVTLRNRGALIIGDVTAQGTFPATSGITTNAGTAYVQAGGNVTQTATGQVNSQALAVGITAGGTIRLDQANTVATFAANDSVTAGLVNFHTTSGLTIDTVTSGSGLLPSIVGLTANAGTALLHAAGGIGQTANGPITAATLAVRNDSTGDISLLQTNYTANTGNTVGTFAGINGAPSGRLDLATLGALSLGTIPGDGTFAQIRGITTNNGGSNLRSGTDFSAVDTNYASPFIVLGSGNFLVNPGQTPVPPAQINSVVRTVTFNAEATMTGTFRLGVPAPGDAPPPPPPASVPDQSPVPANPTGAATIPPAPDNPFRETFNIRPSSNVQILVNGNAPTTAPGDTLNLILTDLPSNAPIRFTPGGIGSGRFDFPGSPTPLSVRKAVPYTGIESIGGFNILATATQTGPTTYSISASGTLQNRPLLGGITGGQAPANPFIVSPNLVNPVQPFGAPRIALGDFNGDGVTDLIIANGPDNAPLVTVVDGRQLFGTPHPLVISDIISQFFAYDPRFQGGLFVAAGDIDGTGHAEIVTGADEGGGSHVRIFAYDPAPGLTIYNNAVDNSVMNPTSPFPAGGFFAYGPNFKGGVRVAVGDVDGDGHQDIITGAGPGGGPHVEVFSGANGQVIRSFYAYNPSFSGGVYVAAGDYDHVANGVVPGDFTADIITGAGSQGKPNVTVFSGANLAVLTQFFAFGNDGPTSLLGADLGVTTGIGSVSIGDVNGDGIPDIIVGSYRGPRTRIAVFQGNSANPPRMLFTNVSPPPAGFVLNPFANLSPPFFTIDNTPTNLDDLISISSFRDGTNVSAILGTT